MKSRGKPRLFHVRGEPSGLRPHRLHRHPAPHEADIPPALPHPARAPGAWRSVTGPFVARRFYSSERGIGAPGGMIVSRSRLLARRLAPWPPSRGMPRIRTSRPAPCSGPPSNTRAPQATPRIGALLLRAAEEGSSVARVAFGSGIAGLVVALHDAGAAARITGHEAAPRLTRCDVRKRDARAFLRATPDRPVNRDDLRTALVVSRGKRHGALVATADTARPPQDPSSDSGAARPQGRPAGAIAGVSRSRPLPRCPSSMPGSVATCRPASATAPMSGADADDSFANINFASDLAAAARQHRFSLLTDVIYVDAEMKDAHASVQARRPGVLIRGCRSFDVRR